MATTTRRSSRRRRGRWFAHSSGKRVGWSRTSLPQAARSSRGVPSPKSGWRPTNVSARAIVLRMQNGFGEWRQLEAHVTDLRADRQIRGVVLNARDITERLRLEEQLTQQAFHDSLTGLPNRALFRDRLDQALARSDRSDDVLAVLLLDLDGFKQVNDSLGHDAGDQLLQEDAVR